MDEKLSVAGGSVRSVTTSDTVHHDKNRVLRTRDDAEGYVASVCFKHGPPRLAGVELEWLVHQAATPAAPLDPRTLRTALGPYAPTSLDPGSPARALPGGSLVTVEPGGQVELASPPLAPFGTLVRTVVADSTVLHDRLAATASPSLRPPQTRCGPRAASSTFPATAPWSTASTGSARGAAAGCAPPPRCRCVSTRGRRPGSAVGGTPCTPWARCWSRRSRTRRCCTAGAPGGSRPGSPPGWPSTRNAPPRRPLVRRPGGRVGPPGARHRAAVRPARRRPVGRAARRHVRRVGPRRRRAARSAHGRRPRVPHLHAVPAGPAARASRDPLHRRPARAALGAAGGGPRRRAVRSGGDGPGTGCLRARARAVDLRRRYGLADRVLQRSAVTVFELALSALTPLDAPSWLVGELTVALERGVRRGLCPADRAGPAPGPPAASSAAVRHTPAPRRPSPAGPADVPEEARA